MCCKSFLASLESSWSATAQIWGRKMGMLQDIFLSTDKGDKSKILSAMRLIEMETCITFLPRTILDRTWIDIEQKKEAGCYSIIGYRPLPHEGPLKFNLRAPECYEAGTIQHELLHVLGLLHEQARPDRDEFVDILWDNIDEGEVSRCLRSGQSWTSY